MTTPAPEPEVIIRREGRAGRITMNRPQALNALTLGMVREIWAALKSWQTDPSVSVVVLDGAGGRALCAGGDVISLYEERASGSGLARAFWAEEYRLNALIGRYRKPFVALQDGIVMGGGIGLSSHARHRIVTERSMLAMPETGIGLIPDVGGTWLLSHAAGELGTYLALTGARMNGSDAIQTGFSAGFLHSDRLGELVARLCDPAGAAPDQIVDELAGEAPVPPSPLMALKPDIDRIFRVDSVEAIAKALHTTTADWAQKAHADLATKSPKSLKVTLAALRRARRLGSLEEALDMEYRLVVRLYEDGEFPEGVRALLVDKDKEPRWKPARLEDLTPEMVAAYFAPLPGGEELGLARSMR
jgi:enoyl-CoA hydratase